MASSTGSTCAAAQYVKSQESEVAKDDHSKTKVKKQYHIGATILNVLHTVREPLAEYQERGGTPREENYSFIPLVTTMAQNAYNVTISIFVMLASFIPLLDGFLLCIRFVLDKLIEIFESEDAKDKVMKTLIFLGELAVIIIMTFLMISLIIMPVLLLTTRLFGKVWGIVWSKN